MKEKQDEKTNDAPKTYDIPEVEIFRAGTWTDSVGRTVTYTLEDIEGMAAANQDLAGRFEAPVKLGHDPEQPLLETDGLPAAGWLRNVRAAGGRLFADLAGVPKKVYELIRAGGYKKRSLEVLHNYRDETTGRVYGHVASGLALLGARLPAIGSLADIRALYGGASGADAAAYLYESGPDGIGPEVVFQQQITKRACAADGTAEDEPLAGRISALEARIAELEALLAEAVAIEEPAAETAVEEKNEDPATDETVEEPSPGEQADDDPIDGTPIETIAEPAEETGGNDKSATPDEPVVEQPADVVAETVVEIAEAPAEAGAMESGLDAKETIIREAAEKLNAALAELDNYRRRESEKRARARQEFAAAHAGKVPPAFRGIVNEVLALLDGDFALVSDYSRGGDSRGAEAADAFRGFIASLPDHPAMSEYGRERAAGVNMAPSPYGGGADGELDAHIRAYCAERGMNPDTAGDYASAAIAVLEYERPPSLNERDCGCAESPAELRDGNNNFSLSLARAQDSEYTVSMNSNQSGFGCIERGRRAGGCGDADYGWWKDLECGVKNERKELQREIREERDEIIHKTYKAGLQAAFQYFAHKLKVIDDEYNSCREVASGQGEKTRCDRNAIESIGKIVKTLEDLPNVKKELIDALHLFVFFMAGTKYPVVKDNVIDAIGQNYPEYAGYFRF